MEENKDKRTDADEVWEDTVVFKREDIPPRQPSQQSSKSNMQHTAKKESGAVIRPLKKQPTQAPTQSVRVPQALGISPLHRATSSTAPTPRQNQGGGQSTPPRGQGSPQKQQSAPQKPQSTQQKPQSTQQKPQSTQQKPQSTQQKPQSTQQKTSPTTTSSNSAKRPLHTISPSVQKEPTASPAQNKSTPSNTKPQGANSPQGGQQQAPRAVQPLAGGPVRTPALQQKPTAGAQPRTGTNTPSTARHPAKQAPIKNGVQNKPSIPQTPKKRTENDDFEIDEITYTKLPRVKTHDSALVDSATSALMSLIKAVIYIVAVIAVSVGIAVFAINVGNDVFKFVAEDKIVTVQIPEYATIEDIADALYDAGAIKYKWAFNFWSNLKTKGKKVEFAEGTYEVSTSLNYDYLRMAFRKNTGTFTEVRVTIPEGKTVDEIITLLVDEKGIGTREGFIEAIQNYDFDYPFLEGLEVSEDRIYRLEGYLFPDTYYFYKESSEVTILSKILDNFNAKFVDAYYARCKDLGITVDEAIILASMVEKETRYADELGLVSSVFHNRLKYSATFPYLNSDATIMYAMQHDLGGRPDGMTGEDTAYETPYNTYTNKGLPPGPIANPGLNSIKYALYPNSSNYFYFVSDATGRMLFATTEPEHLANINTVRGNN